MKEQTIFDNKCIMNLNILIGENAADNWNIIDKADQNDIWFHLENKPSCHVLLCMDNKNIKEISKQTLKHCAILCKNGSKFGSHQNIGVIYTQRKNIKKGEDIGSVITKKTLRIII